MTATTRGAVTPIPYHAVAVFDQAHQQVERLRFEVDGAVAMVHRARIDVDRELAKPVHAVNSCSSGSPRRPARLPTHAALNCLCALVLVAGSRVGSSTARAQPGIGWRQTNRRKNFGAPKRQMRRAVGPVGDE